MTIHEETKNMQQMKKERVGGKLDISLHITSPSARAVQVFGYIYEQFLTRVSPGIDS